MTRLRTIRPALSCLSLVFLGLGLSVFVWGLRYKLSLYDPPQSVSHHMPHAKLLSKDEQTSATEQVMAPDKNDGPAAIAAGAALLPILLLIGFAGRPSISASGSVEHEYLGFTFFWPALSAFFFRPPPAVL